VDLKSTGHSPAHVNVSSLFPAPIQHKKNGYGVQEFIKLNYQHIEPKYIFTTTMNSLSNEIKLGAGIRSEKIERARCIATAIREERQHRQDALEGKLLANERGLKELRKMVDAWKGEESVLQKLEAVVLMKEKECEQSREQVAETYNRWSSMPRYPDSRQMYAIPSAIQKQASSKSKKASTRRHLMLQTHSSENSVRLVPRVVLLMKEREQLLAEASIKWGTASSKSKKQSVTRRVVAHAA
jgi:hypothetical protein